MFRKLGTLCCKDYLRAQMRITRLRSFVRRSNFSFPSRFSEPKARVSLRQRDVILFEK